MRTTSKQLFTLARNDQGIAGVVLAIVALVLVGMVGLAVDIGNWYAISRRNQMAADAAAVAAAFEVTNSQTNATIAASALREAKRNGFTGTECDINITDSAKACRVYNPPKADSGYSSQTNAVQVILTEPTNSFFAGAFVASPTVKSNSVMQVSASSNTSNAGAGTGYCMLALDKTAADAMRVHNNGSVNCGVASNSSANTAGNNAQQGTVALRIDNNGAVTGNAYAVGGVSVENNADLYGNSYAATAASTYVSNNSNITGIKSKSSGEMVDPYANWDPPSSIYSQTCNETALNGGKAYSSKNKSTLNLPPGRYCSGWDFDNQVVLNLQSGVYVIESKLIVGNKAVLNANATGGVTIIMNGNFGLNFGNNAEYYLVAPTTGPYAGIALYSRRTNAKLNSSGNEIRLDFNNNSKAEIQGAIYAPSQKIHFNNNCVITATSCTQVIGNKVEVDNNGGVLFGACNTATTGTTAITTPTSSTQQIKTLQ